MWIKSLLDDRDFHLKQNIAMFPIHLKYNDTKESQIQG